MSGRATIFQIFYSEETRRMLDPGFTPMDNRANLRPDWREYWPIRDFLRTQALQPDHYYGFFAPRFREKTGLTAEQIFQFIDTAPEGSTLIHFTTYSDQAALFINVFEQGNVGQVGLSDVADSFAAAIGSTVKPGLIVNTTRDAVFCNYFVAKREFWYEWLQINEKLFAIAENPDHPLREKLCRGTSYNGITVPMKVFVMERTVSYLLAVNPTWEIYYAAPFELALGNPHCADIKAELTILDALKFAFCETKRECYLDVFNQFRNRLLANAPPGPQT